MQYPTAAACSSGKGGPVINAPMKLLINFKIAPTMSAAKPLRGRWKRAKSATVLPAVQCSHASHFSVASN